jgi:hypothetical protein
MALSQLIAARVTPETKARFRTLAEHQHLTESTLLKHMIDLTIRSVGADSGEVLHPNQGLARQARLCVRLRASDRLLLRERAAARQMAAATYVSVLVRAHLRGLQPLPRQELMALKRVVAELGAIGRNLNQIARAANQGGRVAGPQREDLRAFLNVCEALRDNVKSVIKTNLSSWEAGHAQSED